MAMAKKIKQALIARDMSVKELAAALNCSSPNLSAKFKRDNFTESDLDAIAEVLNCHVDILLVDNETGKPLV